MPNTCKSNELWQFIVRVSGKRVSNTWTIFPRAGDNSGKPELIPNDLKGSADSLGKAVRRDEIGLRPIS